MNRLHSIAEHFQFSLYIIFRPFKGFWDLKHEGRGSVQVAILIVVLVTATEVFRRQATAFLFNYMVDTTRINLLAESTSIVVPLLLWSVANWSLTALMDGDGSFRDIFVATSYALIPLVLINVPLVGLSHLIVQEEGAFYYFFTTLAVIWTGGLIVLGNMVTHQFSLSKSILTALATVVGMGLIIFILLLFFDLIQKMYFFAFTVVREILYRT